MNKGLQPTGALGFAATALILALAAGLCFRAPFDDEAIALAQFELLGLGDVVLFYLGGGDVHPPLFFAVFKILTAAGLGESGLRIVSFLMAIGAFALLLDVALRAFGEGRARRMIVAAIFIACPLLFGVGDALRWYSDRKSVV